MLLASDVVLVPPGVAPRLCMHGGVAGDGLRGAGGVHRAEGLRDEPHVVLELGPQVLTFDDGPLRGRLGGAWSNMRREVPSRRSWRLAELPALAEASGANPPREAIAELRQSLAEHAPTLEPPRLRLRVAPEVPYGDVVRVLAMIADVDFDYEVETPNGPGLLRSTGYICSEVPLDPPLCVIPSVLVTRAGGYLRATPGNPYSNCAGDPDAPPPPETIRYSVDWRGRIVAGPGGVCPSFAAGDQALDRVQLRAELEALLSLAPGCHMATLSAANEVPWSAVAPVLATLRDDLGLFATPLLPAPMTAEIDGCAAAIDPAKIVATP